MADYFVETTGDDSNNGTSVADAWKTLAHAVTAAAPDSTITIGKGTFTESFSISKNLVLQGASSTDTIIQCPPGLLNEPGPPFPGLFPPLGYLPMIHVTGPTQVRFAKLRVAGKKPAELHVNGVFATDPGAHMEIEACEIRDFGFCHVFVLDGTLVLSDSVVGATVFVHSDLGVVAAGQTKATITNTTVGQWTDHCIDVYQNAFAEVVHCTLNGSDTINCNGIRLNNSASAHIAGCTIVGQDTQDVPTNYSQSGIQLWENASANVHDNQISGFASGLLFLNAATARVWGNTITNNFNYGVQYSVLATEIEQPDLGGGLQGSPGENIIKDNGSLTGYDVRLAGIGGTVYARFNEWKTPDVMSHVQIYDNPQQQPEPVYDFLPLKQVPPPQPLDSMLLLDQSGSMLEEGKWESAKSAANVLATALSKINCTNSDLKLGLMTFADTGAEMTHLWKALAALPADPAHFAFALADPQKAWYTPMGEGLLQAKKQLQPLADGRRKYIFLLSDGKNNSGTAPSLAYPTFKQLVNVYSVGFGDDSIDPDMLSEISDATLGDYYLTGSTDNLDLKRFFLFSLATPLGIGIVANTREKGVTTFPVNGGENKMLVMVGWEDAALAIDFDLQDPQGNLISPANLPAGVTYLAEAQASFASYVVEAPADGAWKLLNIRRQDNGPAPEAVRFVAFDPHVVAQFGTDRGPAAIGRKLRLYARLLEGGAPLGDAVVSVKVIAPDQSVGTLAVQHLAHPRVVDRIRTALPKDRLMQRSDVLVDYKRQHQLAALPTTGATLDLHASKAGYFQGEFTPTKEGTYTFEFHADGKTGASHAFHRTYSLSKYVSFAAAPEKTRITVKAVGRQRGATRHEITVVPTSASGQMMGPFNASQFSFHERGRPIPFQIHDALDGSYEMFLVLEKDVNRADIRMRIGNVELPQSPLAAERTGMFERLLGLLISRRR